MTIGSGDYAVQKMTYRIRNTSGEDQVSVVDPQANCRAIH